MKFQLSNFQTNLSDSWLMYLKKLMSLDVADDKSKLVQVMAWCWRHQAITWANVDPDLSIYAAIWRN